MNCKKCGKSNSDTNKFCVYCGCNLNNETTVTNATITNSPYTYKDVAVTTLLCFIPFYYMYLMYRYQQTFYAEGKEKMTPNNLLLIVLGGTILSLLLCFAIVGIFGLIAIWVFVVLWINRASNYLAKESGNENLPMICLMFSLLFPIGAFSFLQNEMNKINEIKNTSKIKEDTTNEL